MGADFKTVPSGDVERDAARHGAYAWLRIGNQRAGYSVPVGGEAVYRLNIGKTQGDGNGEQSGTL